jgi:serine protease Do
MNKLTDSLPTKNSIRDIKTTASADTRKEETKPLMVTVLQLKKMIVLTLMASVIFGGIAGLLFGTLAGSNFTVSTWVQKNIFGKTTAQTSAAVVADQKTLAVTEDSATVDVVKKVSPAVVSIVITQDLSKIYSATNPEAFPFNDFFNFDFPNQQDNQGEQEVGAGTGFIISSDGLILTNKHVVSTEGGEYTVVMNDGKKYDATVVDTDPFNDVALVKIEAQNLTTVELGDSDTLQIGQTVIAIGNTLGEYRNTVTKGVISGLARTVTAGDGQGQSETLEDIIQTDAAINFGNSGGPLLNLAGQVIGVNTAINQSGQLVGFAIPINQVKKDIDSVQKNGKIIRPYLGVRYLLINEEVASQNKLSVDYGALIVKGSSSTELAVIPGSPADKAGLVENDIILEVNGQKIDQDHSLAGQLQKYSVGEAIELKVSHQGAEKTVTATLEEASD